MNYTVQSSEQTTSSASEMETKALLHLLCDDADQGIISNFAIDFFNDVTGMDQNAFRLYDVQSKGTRSGAAELGKDLVTLFKNYTSEFKKYFVRQILFVRGITRPVLGNKTLSEFKYSNMTDNSKKKLRESFILECRNKEYIKNDLLKDEIINDFLEQVLFVVSKEKKEDYILPLIRATSLVGTTRQNLCAIFNEIRRKQLGIKTFSKVEGVSISHPFDVFSYGRVLRKKDIELLVISRIINKNPLEAGIPKSFIPIYENYEEDTADEMIQDCQNDIAKQMFTTTESEAFWQLLDEYVTKIRDYPDMSVKDIYQSTPREILDSCHQMNSLSHQYFISIIKEGVKRD